jgi:hypothetical protein
MDLVFAFVLAGSLIILILFLWMIYCNQKTYDQRIAYIKSCKYDHDVNQDADTNSANFHRAMSRLRVLDDVAYEKHFLYLLTFRDPMPLYEARTNV